MRRRAAVVNLGFHWLGAGLLVLQGLLVTPLYARLIPLDLLGAWMATGNVLAWLSLIDPNISRILQQKVARAYGKGDAPSVKSLSMAGHVLGMGVALAMSGLTPFVRTAIGLVPGAKESGAELEASVVVAVLASSVLVASFAPMSVNLGLQNMVQVGVITVLATSAGLATSILGLLNGWGLVALPAGLLCRATILFVGNLVSVYKRQGIYDTWRLGPDLPALKEIVVPSGFTFVEKVGVAMTSQVEPLAIAYAAGPVNTAQYTITSRPLEPVRIAVDRVLPALGPGLSHLAGDRGNHAVADVIGKVYGPLGGVVSIGVAAVTVASGPLVSTWAGAGTFAGYGVSAAVAIAAVSGCLANPGGEILYSLGDVRSVALGRLLEGTARVALQVLGGILFGVVGVIIGGVIATATVTFSWMNPRVEEAMMLPRGEINRIYCRSFLLGTICVGFSAVLGHILFSSPTSWGAASAIPAAPLASISVLLVGLWGWPGLRKQLEVVFKNVRKSSRTV